MNVPSTGDLILGEDGDIHVATADAGSYTVTRCGQHVFRAEVVAPLAADMAVDLFKCQECRP